jgi:hypothetical protein
MMVMAAVATAPVKAIIAVAAFAGIITSSTHEHVVAIAADEQIIAAPTSHRCGTVAGIEFVVASTRSPMNKNVDRRIDGNNVITSAAPYGQHVDICKSECAWLRVI